MILKIILITSELHSESEKTDYKLLFTIISALAGLIGTIIGGVITVMFKTREIRNLSETLNLQKQLFEEARANNELKLKAELVRLEDLNRQYQLNLQKHDFEHLSKVLEMAGDSNQKAEMLKEFANNLKVYNRHLNNNNYIDFYEHKEFVVNNIYDELDFVKTSIQELLDKYPNVFVGLHSDFRSVMAEASYLIAQIGEYESLNNGFDKFMIMEKLFDSLYNLHIDYIGMFEKMQEEFKELDLLKRKYVRSQYENRI